MPTLGIDRRLAVCENETVKRFNNVSDRGTLHHLDILESVVVEYGAVVWCWVALD
jgi:hypothetical protein